MSIAELTYRLITKDDFRVQILADPKATLASAGLEVTSAEQELLEKLPWSNLLSQRQAPVLEPNINGWWGCQFSRCLSG